MYAKPCYRTLDRPLTVMGLEPADLVLAIVTALALFVFVGQILGIVVGLGIGFGMQRLRAGKAPGYVFELAYRTGVVRILPPFLRPPHLVRPPLPWEPRTIRLSPIEGDLQHDDEEPEVRFYRAGRKRLA